MLNSDRADGAAAWGLAVAQGKAGTCSWAEQLEKDGLDLLAAACMQMGLT